MRLRRRHLSCVVVLALGCTRTESQRTAEAPADTARSRVLVDTARPAVQAGPYTDTLSILARVDSIERYVAAHPAELKLAAKVAENGPVVAVKDTASWPDEPEATYNIMYDSAHRPLVHREMPTSQSGDWFAVQSHYFAPDGRTILYQFEISAFSNGCTDILRETRRIFLNPAGGVIGESRSYTDKTGAPVAADSCYRRSDDAPPPKLSSAELEFPKQ